MHQQLPKVLRLLRMRSGLTGRQFAPRLGKCNSWISKIESGAICITAVDFFAWLIASGCTMNEALQLMRDEGMPVHCFSSLSEIIGDGQPVNSEDDLIGQLRSVAKICQTKHIGLSVMPNGEFKIRHKGD